MKKIGLLALALVIAIGGLGIGYAAWTDTLYIEGTVETGNVDIDIEDFSGTWLYKMTVDEFGDEAHGVVKLHGWGTAGNRPAPTAIGAEVYELISYAETVSSVSDPDGSGSDSAIVEFDNLLACEVFLVDFLVHYNGTIPARLCVDLSDIGSPLDQWIIDSVAGYEAYEWNPDYVGADPMGAVGAPVDLCGLQLEECEWILVKIWVHIPQDDAYEGLGPINFSITCTALQWNEYPAECPPPVNP